MTSSPRSRERTNWPLGSCRISAGLYGSLGGCPVPIIVLFSIVLRNGGLVLNGKPNGGIRCTVATIASPTLHHFKEDSAKSACVEVEKLTVFVPVEEKIEFLQRGQEIGADLEPCIQVVVIVERNRQKLHASVQCAPRGRYQILGGKGDVLWVACGRGCSAALEREGCDIERKTHR